LYYIEVVCSAPVFMQLTQICQVRKIYKIVYKWTYIATRYYYIGGIIKYCISNPDLRGNYQCGGPLQQQLLLSQCRDQSQQFFTFKSPQLLTNTNINPFIFINSLSWPWCVQPLFSLNCLKLTISEFLYNLLLVSYGDNEIKKKVKSYA
jgi:hypothetical protein